VAKVIIDSNAGPCSGVQRALHLVERTLQEKKTVYALGSLIHNSAEVQRLEKQGLVTLDQQRVEDGETVLEDNSCVFVRSHGISESFYKRLRNQELNLVDGTCPTVGGVQRKIKRYFDDGYQIVIIGKPSHPEVRGLNGYCNNQAIVVNSVEKLVDVVLKDKCMVISQTTMSQDVFAQLADYIRKRAPQAVLFNTICPQVKKRNQNIRNFAQQVNVVLLVGGKQSSNTRVLFDISKQCNPDTYWIENQHDIQMDWFSGAEIIGITGSASTPVWQLQKIQDYLECETLN